MGGTRTGGWVLALLALVACLAAAPAGAVTVGLSQSDPSTVTNPNFAGLGATYVRAVVPYDVAETTTTTGAAGQRRTAFINWLNAIAAWNATAGNPQLTPLVALSASLDPANEDPATGNPLAPSLAQYSGAVQALVQQFGPGTQYDVSEFAAWNEPDLTDPGANPLRGNPALAAQLWVAAQQACPGCTVPAGELAAVAPGDTWIDQYQAALQSAAQAANVPLPSVWSWHPYTDVNDFQNGGRNDAPVSRWYLNQLAAPPWNRAQVWLDEVGSYYRNASGVVWGDGSQGQATEFLLGLAALSSRVTRIYYYDLTNICSTAARCAIQDRGLVAPTPQDGSAVSYDTPGRVRTSWSVLADRGPVIAPVAPILPGVTLTAPAGPPAPVTALSGAAGAASGDSSTVTARLYSGQSAGGTPLQTLTATRAGGNWSAPLPAPLSDGTYTAEATQLGATGDLATSQPVTFTVDTAPPVTSIGGAPKARTTARSATLTFTATKPNATFACSLDGRAFSACSSPYRLRHLALGRHNLQVRATDANGLAQTTPSGAAWTIVSPPPIVFAPGHGRLLLAHTLLRGLKVTGRCPQACSGKLRAYITRAQADRLRVRDGKLIRASALRLRGTAHYLAVGRVAVHRSRAGRLAVTIAFDRAARGRLALSRTKLALTLAGSAGLADGSSARLRGRATLVPR